MKAIATVSMYDMGAANRSALTRSQSVEQRKAVIAAAARQRWVEAEGGATHASSTTSTVLRAASLPRPAHHRSSPRTRR
ncbi:hypothetical protein G6F21_014683 [Rhizopus arrhizus]|nr:hypothetical protein G6F21_014683 [Rhizopus arrhizus]